MPVEAVGIVMLVLITSFFLVPSQIMLATSNRVGLRFVEFKGLFPYWQRRRLLIGVLGSTIVLATLLMAQQPIWTSVLVFVVVAAQYVSDFYIVEGMVEDMK